MSKTLDYRAFLMRLWRESQADRWRVRLEEPTTGARRSFASVEAFYEYLEGVLDQAERPRGVRHGEKWEVKKS